ncbi:MAG: porin [Vicinamibacterales bacterium]
MTRAWTLASTMVWTTALSAGAQPAATPPPASPTITLGGYVQGELDAGAVGDTRFPASDRFFVRRARLTASGTAAPTFAYRVQVEFAGGLGAASSVSATLTDGCIEWTKFAEMHVLFGQMKAPFGREWLVPSTRLDTVERTLVTDRLTLNRQIGVEVTGTLQDARAGYLAGVFNGNGRNTTVNDNSRFMYVLRGNVVPWRTSTGRLDVGASGYWSNDTRLSMPSEFAFDSTPATTGADNLFTGHRTGLGVDAHFQQEGWRAEAEALHVRFDQDAPAAHPLVVSDGWHVSAARNVYRPSLQVVGRYERYRPDTSIDGNETRTWLGGFNYYVHADRAKLMADCLWVDAPNDPASHAKLLAQLQVVF